MTSDGPSLARLALFADAPPGLLDDLVAADHERPLAPGQTLLREGDPGNDVMIVSRARRAWPSAG